MGRFRARASLPRHQAIRQRAIDEKGGRGFGALGGFPVLRELLAGRDRGTGGQQRAEFLAFEPVVGAVEVGVGVEWIFVGEHERAHPRALRSGLHRELAVVRLAVIRGK